jgi:hypothetical protein
VVLEVKQEQEVKLGQWVIEDFREIKVSLGVKDRQDLEVDEDHAVKIHLVAARV